MFIEHVRISPRYVPRDFIELNLDLNSPTHYWDKGLNIFRDRMESRFLLIVQDMLLNMKKDYMYIDYSFSIMGLNCLFIEALRQFELGLDATESYRGANLEAFKDFFNRSFFFDFSPRISKLFYKHVRCGILHQAQTQGNTQLTFDQDLMVKMIDEESIRVDVEKFSNALFSEYEYYLERLKDPDQIQLRTKFIRKMNFIIDRIR